MKEPLTSNKIWVGVGVVVLIIGAYVVGQGSKSPAQAVDTVSQTSPTAAQAPAQAETKSADDITAASSNGLACKKIAYAAASVDDAQAKKTDAMGSVTVLRTHYSQTTGNCYYEVSSAFSGGLETSIRVAPNDDWLAYCSYTSGTTICNEHGHQGLETEEQFRQLEKVYLTN